MSEQRIDVTTIRPPQEAFTDRDAAARFREATFPSTSWTNPSMRLLNLGGATGMTLGAITELLAPVIRGLAARSYGNLAVGVISSDGPVEVWLESMVAEFKAPVFLAASMADSPRALRPAGALSATEASTLDIVIDLGGAMTAAQLASAAGLEAGAASNRLNTLERRGYLLRVSRSRREGDLYLEPGTRAVSPIATTMTPAAEPADEATLAVPASVHKSLAAVAERVGRDPEELLAEAWHAYLLNHMADFNADIGAAREVLRHSAPDQDDAELAAWAAAAAERARGD